MDASGMQFYNSCTELSVALRTKASYRWLLWPSRQSPNGTSFLQALLSMSAPLGLWIQCLSSKPQTWGTQKGHCVLLCGGKRGHVSMVAVLIVLLQDQSFLVLLALAMFSWRFCFFFCSRSRASIILANFQDISALAMKSGVRASMTVVRNP